MNLIHEQKQKVKQFRSVTVLLWFPAIVQSRSCSTSGSVREKPKLKESPGRTQTQLRHQDPNWLQVCSRPHSSTSSTTTWTDSSSCLASAFAFSVVSVSLSGACGSCSSAGWPVWPCQTLLSGSSGSAKSTPCRPQLQSPPHSPGRLLGPRVAPGTSPDQ